MRNIKGESSVSYAFLSILVCLTYPCNRNIVIYGITCGGGGGGGGGRGSGGDSGSVLFPFCHLMVMQGAFIIFLYFFFISV